MLCKTWVWDNHCQSAFERNWPLLRLKLFQYLNREVLLQKKKKKPMNVVSLYASWPVKVSQDVCPYYTRRIELSIETGCLIWGIWVIMFERCRNLHFGYGSSVHCKNEMTSSNSCIVARTYNTHKKQFWFLYYRGALRWLNIRFQQAQCFLQIYVNV